MSEGMGNKKFITGSFILILLVSLIDACTAPVFYSLRDVKSWGRLIPVGICVTFFVVFWAYRLWNQVIPNIKNWKKLTFYDSIGLVAIILLVRHLLP